MDSSIKQSSVSINPASSISSKRSRRSERSQGSRGSPKISASKKPDLDSEDISLSQLELMANKKKITKAVEEVSLVSKRASDSIKNDTRDRIDARSSSISVSSSSSSSDKTRDKRRKERFVSRENQDEEIRKEKSEYLFKFNKLNVKGKWSSLRLDMNSSLEEIRNEYERVRNEIQTERSVAFFKRMLLLGVQGIEMLNTKFDPLGVDLDGWSEAMGYSMENQEYDEVMTELYEKYKGRGQMSPELKLVFMIISSATMFTVSKKITKMDSNNALKTLLGGLMGNKAQAPVTQQQQYAQQQYAQQQYAQQQLSQQQYAQLVQNQMIPNPAELRNERMDTETSEDIIPSKMNGPNTTYIPQDGNDIDIENILKTMNERKREKSKALTETTDDILKSIPMTQKRGRGRPKKNNNNLRMQ